MLKKKKKLEHSAHVLLQFHESSLIQSPDRQLQRLNTRFCSISNAYNYNDQCLVVDRDVFPRYTCVYIL